METKQVLLPVTCLHWLVKWWI